MKIGIIGNGFVGKATKILKSEKVEIMVYDIIPELCEPRGLTLEKLCNETDIIFISVPTPTNKDGSCHLNILNSVVNDIKQFSDLNKKLVVVRSTVPPGTSDSLNCYFMPEFLTEKNFERDFINNKNWVFGLKGTNQDELFEENKHTWMKPRLDTSFSIFVLKLFDRSLNLTKSLHWMSYSSFFES